MQKSNEDVFVFLDGNWLLNRAFSVFQTRYDKDRIIIKTFIGWVCDYAVKLKATHLCVAFDGDKVFRHEAYEGYKASRKARKAGVGIGTGVSGLNHQVDDEPSSEEASPYDCLDDLKVELNRLGLKWYQDPRLEADDLLVSAACHLSSKAKRIYLVTLDKDVNQAVVGNVLKFVPAVGKNTVDQVVDEEALKLMPPYLTGEGLIDYQTLIGDSTDDIPKLMGPSKAARLLREHGTLRNYVSATEEGKDYWDRNQEELKRNRTLVRLLPKAWEPSKESLALRPVEVRNTGKIPKAWFELMGSLTSSKNKKRLF